jgi:hypothetical protein
VSSSDNKQSYHIRSARSIALINLLRGVRRVAPVQHLRTLIAQDGLPLAREDKALFLRWKFPGQDVTNGSALVKGAKSFCGPLPTHSLQVDPISIFELLLTTTIDRKQWIRMQRKWNEISDAADRSFAEMVQKLLRAIAKIGHQRDLRVQEITLDAMLAMLYEPDQVPVAPVAATERVAELELQPLCGLALATDTVNADRIDSLLFDAAEARAFLPICRIDTTAGADRNEGDVEFQEMEEAIALAPLLQPIRLLVDVTPGEEQPVPELQGSAVQRMACRLQALEPAVHTVEHDGVLKGLVVESPDSVRLVLYVRNVLGEWETWVTPPTSNVTDFVNSLALAVLRPGRKLVKAFLKIDRKRGGDVAARHA